MNTRKVTPAPPDPCPHCGTPVTCEQTGIHTWDEETRPFCKWCGIRLVEEWAG